MLLLVWLTPSMSRGVFDGGMRGGATPVPSESVQGNSVVGKWEWQKTQMSDGKETTPVKSDEFVLTLSDEGKLSSTTDCNTLNGSYELLEDNGIKISPLAQTMMYCEGSQEAEYSQALQSVNIYKVSGNELWLMLPFDSGTMIFGMK